MGTLLLLAWMMALSIIDLFLVGLPVLVICIIKRNIQYHRGIETSGV